MGKKMIDKKDSELQKDCMSLLEKIEGSIPIKDSEIQKELGVLTNLISKISMCGNEIQLANATIAVKASISGTDNGDQVKIIKRINGELSEELDGKLYDIRSQYNIGVLFVMGIFFLASIILYVLRFIPEIGYTNLSAPDISAAFFSAACGHLVRSSNDAFINKQKIINRPSSIIRGMIQSLSTAIVGVFFASILFPLIRNNLLSKGMWEAWIYILLAGFGGWAFFVLKHDVLAIFKEKDYFHSKSNTNLEP